MYEVTAMPSIRVHRIRMDCFDDPTLHLRPCSMFTQCCVHYLDIICNSIIMFFSHIFAYFSIIRGSHALFFCAQFLLRVDIFLPLVICCFLFIYFPTFLQCLSGHCFPCSKKVLRIFCACLCIFRESATTCSLVRREVFWAQLNRFRATIPNTL